MWELESIFTLHILQIVGSPQPANRHELRIYFDYILTKEKEGWRTYILWYVC